MAGESNKGIFEIFKNNIRQILTQKNLEVARTRQDSKKDLQVHQDNRHLLLNN
jgi:hypothetical protein